MKRLIVSSVLSCLFLCVAAAESEDDKLSSWYPQRYSDNPQLVRIAEPLWNFGSGKGVSMYDFGYQQKWHSQCERYLVNYCEMHNPDMVRRSRYAKSQDALKMLKDFFDDYEDCSTAGMLNHQALINSFLSYGIVAEEKEIIRFNKNFVQEIKAWERLRKAMNRFVCVLVEAEEGTGSMTPLLAVGMQEEILKARLKDTKRIHASYVKKSKTATGNVETAKRNFLKAVNRAPVEKVYKQQLITGFNAWLTQRKSISGTATMINGLAKVL